MTLIFESLERYKKKKIHPRKQPYRDTKAMRGPGGNIQAAKTMAEMAARESDAMAVEILCYGLACGAYLRSSKRNSNDRTNSLGNTRARLSIIYRTLKTTFDFEGIHKE